MKFVRADYLVHRDEFAKGTKSFRIESLGSQLINLDNVSTIHESNNWAIIIRFIGGGYMEIPTGENTKNVMNAIPNRIAVA